MTGNSIETPASVAATDALLSGHVTGRQQGSALPDDNAETEASSHRVTSLRAALQTDGPLPDYDLVTFAL